MMPCSCSIALVLVPLGDVIGLCLHGDCLVKTLLENVIIVFYFGIFSFQDIFIAQRVFLYVFFLSYVKKQLQSGVLFKKKIMCASPGDLDTDSVAAS